MARSTRSTRFHRDERGMALAIALFALVVIGALVAGTAFAGQLEMGGGRSAIATGHASEQAETAIADAFENWDSNWNTQAVGTASAAVTTTTGLNRKSYTVTRLGGLLALIRSTGERLTTGGDIVATRELAMLARIVDPNVDVDAAVEGMGDVRVGGTSKVSGFDTNPAGWGACTTPLDDVPGVKASGDVSTTGGADIIGEVQADGNQFVENDAGVTAQRFQDIYDALLPAVTRTSSVSNWNGMEPTTASGACDRSNTNNWGEPGDPDSGPLVPLCRSFMPVTLFTASTTINTGRGQGIILVQGDLRIQGTFIFDGIILATGNIDFHGTGGANSRIYGAMFSANTIDVDDLISISGAPVITYSSCAVQAVLEAAGRGLPLSRRPWAQTVY